MDRPTLKPFDKNCAQCVEHRKHISSLETLNAELMEGIDNLIGELRAAGITKASPHESRTKYASTRPSGIATYRRVNRAGWQTR